MIDVFFMEQQRLSKITQVNTFLLFSGLAVLLLGGGTQVWTGQLLLTRPELSNPSRNYFTPQETCRACLKYLFLLLSSPWPEGLQIHVSKLNNKKILNLKSSFQK